MRSTGHGGQPINDIGSTSVVGPDGVVSPGQLSHSANAAMAITHAIPPIATAVILRAALRLSILKACGLLIVGHTSCQCEVGRA